MNKLINFLCFFKLKRKEYQIELKEIRSKEKIYGPNFISIIMVNSLFIFISYSNIFIYFNKQKHNIQLLNQIKSLIEPQQDTTKTLTLPNTNNDDNSIVNVNNITNKVANSNPCISNIIAESAASLLEINPQTGESPESDIKKVK